MRATCSQRGVSHAPTGRNLPARGFSLPELVVIVGIILAVSVLIAPNIQASLNAYRLNTALSALSGKLSEAKFKAQAQNTDYEIVPDTVNHEYSLEQMTSASPRSFALPAGEAPVALPMGMSFSYGSLTVPAGDPGDQPSLMQSTDICFNTQGMPVDNNGQPTSANAFYLDYQGLYGAVTVSLAGRVQTWLWNGSEWTYK